MAQSSPRKRKRKSSGKGAAGPSLSPGQLTQRLRSIPQEARDGIPQGDDSAGALIFGLLMVLVAVGFVGWHYLRRFLGPTVPPARIEPASPEISQLTHLPLVQSVPLTVYAFDDSGIYLVPLQVEAASPDQELAILRKALEAASTPDGLGRLLPGDTRLRDLRREGPLAIVDLPQEALAQAGGATGQQVLLEGLTRAVTSVPGITQVQFVVDGRSVAYTDAG
ncbi:MAG TPA: GerMN domain-containing protein, partial [bacterium]|nr:GerMN domain-containing protein [bacterium]